jgi:hypothetical protein
MTRLTLAGAFGHGDLRIVSEFTGTRFLPCQQMDL